MMNMKVVFLEIEAKEIDYLDIQQDICKGALRRVIYLASFMTSMV